MTSQKDLFAEKFNCYTAWRNDLFSGSNIEMTSSHLVFSTLSVIFLALAGCGGSGSNQSPGAGVADQVAAYKNIDQATGFSSSYLNGKTFLRSSEFQPGDHFIQQWAFSSDNVSWSDNLFNSNGSNGFQIIDVNGLSGVLTYNDGVYDLFYNVHSVGTDHLKVCYQYGPAPTGLCSEPQSLTWSFDPIPTDSLILGSWTYTHSGSLCVTSIQLNADKTFSTESLNEITAGNYQFIQLNGSNSRYHLSLRFTSDNGLADCDGSSVNDSGSTLDVFVDVTASGANWFSKSNDFTPVYDFTRD